MLSFSLDSSAARARLDAMPRQVHDALLQKVDALRQDLYACVVDQKLSGQVLQVKSGALRASIVSDIIDEGDAIRATVGSDGDVKYAAIQEFGGKTAAHDILPDKARALAFVAGGKQVFAKIVHHPGSTIPERSYLRSALADMRDEIIEAVTQAAVDGLQSP